MVVKISSQNTIFFMRLMKIIEFFTFSRIEAFTPCKFFEAWKSKTFQMHWYRMLSENLLASHFSSNFDSNIEKKIVIYLICTHFQLSSFLFIVNRTKKIPTNRVKMKFSIPMPGGGTGLTLFSKLVRTKDLRSVQGDDPRSTKPKLTVSKSFSIQKMSLKYSRVR